MEISFRVEEVKDKKQYNLFFKFPYILFKDDSMWVPQILFDEKNILNPKKNPAFDFCEARMFLVYQADRVVGRIVGILNHRSNEIWGQKRMRFGWFDFIDNKEVAQLLLKAVEDWAKEKGMNEIVGPMGFTDMDKEGMVIEGFDVNAPMACYYNPSYYPKVMEQIEGYVKEVDWIQYEIPANQPVPEKVEKINNLIKEKYNLKVVKDLSKKEFVSRYGNKIFNAINKSFANLFGYVPLTDKQIKYYISQYFPFIDLRLVCLIVDESDDVVAFGISMPSFCDALRKCKGKLFPLGWFYMLRALKNFNYIDLYMNGVVPQWQNKGIHSIYYAEMNTRYIKLGAKMAIANPQLETNQAAQMWEKYNSKIAIRRRAYLKKID